MNYILGNLSFWFIAALIISIIDFGLLVALAVLMFTRKSGGTPPAKMKKWPYFVLGAVFIAVAIIGFLVGEIIICIFFGLAGLFIITYTLVTRNVRKQ
jgi:hypothetical protein